jgi:hypothetical protein
MMIARGMMKTMMNKREMMIDTTHVASAALRT